jgi:hypothetical protein
MILDSAALHRGYLAEIACTKKPRDGGLRRFVSRTPILRRQCGRHVKHNPAFSAPKIEAENKALVPDF